MYFCSKTLRDFVVVYKTRERPTLRDPHQLLKSVGDHLVEESKDSLLSPGLSRDEVFKFLSGERWGLGVGEGPGKDFPRVNPYTVSLGTFMVNDSKEL